MCAWRWQIVKNTCVELDLGDTDAIPGALRKMKRVIAMVPTLEAFYKQICNYVLVHDSASSPAESKADAAGRIGDRILPVLQRWVRDLRTLEAHRDFHKTVQRELLKRVQLGKAPTPKKLSRQQVCAWTRTFVPTAVATRAPARSRRSERATLLYQRCTTLLAAWRGC